MDNNIIKNRIIGTGEEPLDQILYNPKNWRIHPRYQQDALEGVLKEIGIVQTVIINNITGNLIDGHLRCRLAEKNGQTTIPVTYVELSEEEEEIILTSFDPISAMATTDKEKLTELINSIKTENETIQNILNSIEDINKLGNKNEGTALDILTLNIDEPLTEVQPGDIYYLGNHVLVCASTIKNSETWRPYFSDNMILVPWANPLTLLSDLAEKTTVLALNPHPYVCGHIIDRYKETNPDKEIIKL